MTMPNLGGRPCLLDSEPETIKHFLFFIEEQESDETACGLSGIAIGTLSEWKRNGRRDIEDGLDTKYSKFMTDYNNAYNLATREAVQKIRVAGETSWQAAAWWAERRRRKEYNPHYAKFNMVGETDEEKIACIIMEMNKGNVDRDYGNTLINVFLKKMEIHKLDDITAKLDEIEKRFA